MWLPLARPQHQKFGPQCAAGDSAAHTPQLFQPQGSLVVRVAPQRGAQVGGASNRGPPVHVFRTSSSRIRCQKIIH